MEWSGKVRPSLPRGHNNKHMAQKKQGNMNMPVIFLVLVALIGIFAWSQSMKASQEAKIGSVTQLDQASKDLDAVDVDGLGNEFSQMDADAATF
jgi:hypothetical protein